MMPKGDSLLWMIAGAKLGSFRLVYLPVVDSPSLPGIPVPGHPWRGQCEPVSSCLLSLRDVATAKEVAWETLLLGSVAESPTLITRKSGATEQSLKPTRSEKHSMDVLGSFSSLLFSLFFRSLSFRCRSMSFLLCIVHQELKDCNLSAYSQEQVSSPENAFERGAKPFTLPHNNTRDRDERETGWQDLGREDQDVNP